MNNEKKYLPAEFLSQDTPTSHSVKHISERGTLAFNKRKKRKEKKGEVEAAAPALTSQ